MHSERVCGNMYVQQVACATFAFGHGFEFQGVGFSQVLFQIETKMSIESYFQNGRGHSYGSRVRFSSEVATTTYDTYGWGSVRPETTDDILHICHIWKGSVQSGLEILMTIISTIDVTCALDTVWIESFENTLQYRCHLWIGFSQAWKNILYKRCLGTDSVGVVAYASFWEDVYGY